MQQKILEKVKVLKQMHERIDERRDQWHSFAKKNIISVFNNVASIETDLRTSINENSTNFEALFLTFGKVPSGISQQTNSFVKAYSKIGGHISFGQTFNGQVAVAVCYPYIEEITGKINNKELGIFDPEELSIDRVFELVETFFDEMIKWEKGGLR